MKKSYWIVYGFFNYLINFLITVICRFVWQFLIDNVIYGCSWTQTKIMLSNRIEGVLTIIFLVGIYTSINLLVYKLITKRYKLTNIYLLIPIGTMILGIVRGCFLMCR